MPAARLLLPMSDVLEEERCDSNEVLRCVERMLEAFLLALRKCAEKGCRPRFLVNSDGRECRKEVKSSYADD